VANRWFVKNRGLAVGILTASNASGQLVFLPVLAAIAEGGHWRMVSWVVAAFAALLIPIVLLMLPESPRTIGLGPLGAEVEPEPVRRKNPVGMALNGLTTGMRSADFWLLAGSFAICGFSANGLVGTHLISYCMDNGIAPVAAASVVAGMGVFDLIGTTCSGWLSDRYNPRILLFWYYGLRGLSLILLPFSSFDPISLGAFSVFYGLDFVATVPPTVMLANQVFGRQAAPIIVAWLLCGHQIGAAIAAAGAGWIRSTTGSYFEAFIISGIAHHLLRWWAEAHPTSPADGALPPVAEAARPGRACKSASSRCRRGPAAVAGCADRRRAPADATQTNAAARAAIPARDRGRRPAPPA
jgi:sugar phosphate permease